MPTYAFKCTCGNSVELRRSVDTRHLPVTCQKCGNEMTFEFCAPGAILFRGPGFHATDYPKRP